MIAQAASRNSDRAPRHHTYLEAMYTPAHFAENNDAEVLELVRGTGFGHLVCHAKDGLFSTPLPFIVDDALGLVRFHLARANPMWRSAPCSALLIVAVSDAYISPGWYPSKAEHGEVVPTWNYEVVHVHGQLTLHDDPAWLHTQIGELTDHNETSLPRPWSVEDAPADFIAKQAKAIVGLELRVERVEAKRKLSQNRSEADHAGAIVGLREETSGGGPIASAMTAKANSPKTD